MSSKRSTVSRHSSSAAPPAPDRHIAGGLLEGSYPDRRMVTFDSLDDVAAKRPRLEAAIREGIDIKDREAESH